jgi:hypothetical protein
MATPSRFWRVLRCESPLRFLLKVSAFLAHTVSPRCFEFAALYDALHYPQYAVGLQMAARHAKHFGLGGFSAVEFGVAGGRGLLTLSNYAQQVSRTTGLKIEVVGFDTGKGLPKSLDWRDTPWRFNQGDYPCDIDVLRARLNGHADLKLGDVAETVPEWLSGSRLPLGFMAIDVDYYSSTISILRAIDSVPPDRLVPIVATWLDDIYIYGVPDFAGELAAIQDRSRTMRAFSRADWITEGRPYSERLWLRKMHELFCLDHPLM